MDNLTLVTTAMVEVCDNCPWVKTDNLIQAAHDSPKWFDRCTAAWREVVSMGPDVVAANVAYVNQRVGVDLTTDWIIKVYNGN
jgi:hypothetical protein